MILPLLTLLIMVIGMDCELIELVVFHPMDQIHSIMDTDHCHQFNPYEGALFGVNQYVLMVKQSLTRYFELFQSDDLLILNMTMGDIHSVLCEITSTQIETLNLTDNIHRPKDFRMTRWNCKRRGCQIHETRCHETI